MSRKGESVTLSLDTIEKGELEIIALQFGCTWGEKPNISALMKSIARGKLKVSWNDETPSHEISRNQARAAIERIKQGLDELGRSF